MRLSPLWLSASSFACHGLLIITVITPLPTAQRDKNARELLANAAITDMQMPSAWCCCARCKYNEELADAKAENDAYVMMLLLVSRCCNISSLSVSAQLPPPPAWIMQPPPTGRHRWIWDYFTLRERLITMQKQLEGTQKYINEQYVDRVAHIDGHPCNYCEHTRFQRSINA